jgi:hypothetical protein
MEKNKKEVMKSVLKQNLIHEIGLQSYEIAKAALKGHISKFSITGTVGVIISILISIYFSNPWLILIGLGFYYGVYSFSKHMTIMKYAKYSYKTMIETTLEGNVTLIQEMKEDLDVKTNNNIYSESEIKSIEDTIEMLTDVNEALKDMKE